jgi:hypothetical protein
MISFVARLSNMSHFNNSLRISLVCGRNNNGSSLFRVGNLQLRSKFDTTHIIFEKDLSWRITFKINDYLFCVVTFQLNNYFQPSKTAKSHNIYYVKTLLINLFTQIANNHDPKTVFYVFYSPMLRMLNL